MADCGSRVSTNDLGQFRLFNLSPGEYLVVAAPPVTTPSADSSRDPGTVRRSGFLKTYYPGSQDVGGARLVVVRSGNDVTNVDFALAFGPLATVAIDAVDSRGQPLGREASATLNHVGDVYLPSSMRQASRVESGQFVLRDVPPGDYYLIVNTSYRQEEAAYLNVKVDGDATLKVQTNAGAKVAGRFVVQGTPGATNRGERISNVEIAATPPPGWTGPRYAKDALVQPQGTDRFELTGLRGPMVLHAQMAGALLLGLFAVHGHRGVSRNATAADGRGHRWPWTDFYLLARASGAGPLPGCCRAQSGGHVSNRARHSRTPAPARGGGHPRGERDGQGRIAR
jgi:hypothetical protein